jgi:nitroreductase
LHVYEALYTTSAMRRVRSDPIPALVQARILDAAIRAPSGGNSQNWRFILVDDPPVKAKLGPLYRDCIAQLWATAYKERLERARATRADPASAALLRVQASAQHLADHFEDVPLFLMAFARNDPSGGSIAPTSAWPFPSRSGLGKPADHAVPGADVATLASCAGLRRPRRHPCRARVLRWPRGSPHRQRGACRERVHWDRGRSRARSRSKPCRAGPSRGPCRGA